MNIEHPSSSSHINIFRLQKWQWAWVSNLESYIASRTQRSISHKLDIYLSPSALLSILAGIDSQ